LYDFTNSLERDVLKSVKIFTVDSIKIKNKSGRKIQSPRTDDLCTEEGGSVFCGRSSVLAPDFGLYPCIIYQDNAKDRSGISRL
jgi:hypothetical protein